MKMPEKKTRMSRSTVTISDLLLEQYSLGELPARLSKMVKDELEHDADLRARLSALADSDKCRLAAELGVTEYSVKAMNSPKQVVSRVRALLGRSKQLAVPDAGVCPACRRPF